MPRVGNRTSDLVERLMLRMRRDSIKAIDAVRAPGESRQSLIRLAIDREIRWRHEMAPREKETRE